MIDHDFNSWHSWAIMVNLGQLILPASFGYSGNFPFARQFPKTNSANIKISHIARFTAAFPTAPNNSRRKFRGYFASFSFGNLCLCSHKFAE